MGDNQESLRYEALGRLAELEAKIKAVKTEMERQLHELSVFVQRADMHRLVRTFDADGAQRQVLSLKDMKAKLLELEAQADRYREAAKLPAP